MNPLESNACCARCGYRLCGLQASGVCPECGAAVSDSLREARLPYADPQWLRRVALGLKWLRTSWISFGSVLIATIVFFAGVGFFHGSVVPAVDVVGRIGFWLAALSMIGVGIGLWMSSAPEPRDDATDLLSTSYHVLSVAIVPVFGLWRMWVTSKGSHSWPPPLQQLTFHLCWGAVWLHSALMERHALKLSERCDAGDERRPASRRRRLAGMTALPLLLLALYWIGPIRLSRAGRWTMPPHETQQMVQIVVTLAWLNSVGAFCSIARRVAAEVRA